MTFETSQLPKHPEIEKAYAAATAFFEGDDNEFMQTGTKVAKLLADTLQDKNPDVIAAGLVWSANAWFGEKFPVLEGTQAQVYVEAATALAQPNSAKPDMTVPEYRMASRILLANAILIADDVRTRDKSIEDYRDLGQDMYAAYCGAHQNDREQLLSPTLQKLRAWIDPLASALKDEEPQLVKAYGDALTASEQSLAAPLPARISPAPPSNSAPSL